MTRLKPAPIEFLPNASLIIVNFKFQNRKNKPGYLSYEINLIQ